jgi:phage-related protein
LPKQERKAIGSDLLSVQWTWPVGLPLVRHLEEGLWEVRSTLGNRIARVLFTVEGSSMVLLHGFIKKTQKTPLSDLRLAKDRLRQLKRGR